MTSVDWRHLESRARVPRLTLPVIHTQIDVSLSHVSKKDVIAIADSIESRSLRRAVAIDCVCSVRNRSSRVANGMFWKRGVEDVRFPSRQGHFKPTRLIRGEFLRLALLIEFADFNGSLEESTRCRACGPILREQHGAANDCSGFIAEIMLHLTSVTNHDHIVFDIRQVAECVLKDLRRILRLWRLRLIEYVNDIVILLGGTQDHWVIKLCEVVFGSRRRTF